MAKETANCIAAMFNFGFLSSTITVLAVLIGLLSIIWLGWLFVPSGPIVKATNATSWTRLKVSYRLRFFLGFVLLLLTGAAFHYLMNGTGPEIFALVLIAMGCGGSGLYLSVHALHTHSQSRARAIQMTGGTQLGHIRFFSLVAFGALLYIMGLWLPVGFAWREANPARLAELSLTCLILLPAMCVAIAHNSERKLAWFGSERDQFNWGSLPIILLLAIWNAVLRDDWRRFLAPFIGVTKPPAPDAPLIGETVAQAEFVFLWFQGYLTLLFLLTLFTILLLPHLRNWIALLGQRPMAMSLMLGVALPVIVSIVEDFSLDSPDGPAGSMYLYLLVGGLIGAVLWFVTDRTSRHFKKSEQPFHAAQFIAPAVAALVLLLAPRWTVNHLSGAQSFFITAMLTTILSSWNIHWIVNHYSSRLSATDERGLDQREEPSFRT